jgi:4,5-dihydroxyphthalate decarboxylase
LLQHEYGVAASDIHWWTGGLTTSGYVERIHHALPAGVKLDMIPNDRTLEGMLSSGELDALVTVRPPVDFCSSSTSVRRLFSDYRSVERDYFRRTRFFPIMHLIVLRRDLYEQHRWMAVNLVEAFTQAKRLGRERLRMLDSLAVSLPWLAWELEEIDTLFDGDPFPYGVSANRPVLEAMTKYSYEQGLSNRHVELDELFAPETIGDRMDL